MNVLSERRKKHKRTAARWHVLRAEQFLKAFPDRRLSTHDTEEVVGYLEKVGRIGRISDWQLARIVGARQILP